MFNKSLISKLNYYFKDRYKLYDYTRGWLKGDCPFCGKENKFGVNIYTDRVNCFVCGGHGNIFNAVMNLEELESYKEAKKYILDISGDIDEYIPKGYDKYKQEIKNIVETNLPEGFKLLNQGKSSVSKILRSYIKGRRFNVDILSAKGWGYTEGNDDYFGYIIIPYYKDNKVVYFNSRLVIGNGPRYKNPEKGDKDIGKSMIWYNHDAMLMYSTIFITEGAINAETMGPQAISSGGKFISNHQINDIINSDVEKVIILLDPDALKQSADLALSLIDTKKVKIVILPKIKNKDGSYKYLDCNDIGRKETMRLIYKSNYMNYKDIIKLKNQVNEEKKRPLFTY